MLVFLTKRLLAFVPIIFGVAVVTFVLILLTPGNPADVMLPEGTSDEARIEYAHQLHLDGTVWERFGAWSARALRGDLGESTLLREPAREVVTRALRNTFKLASATLAIAIVGGIIFGLLMGWWAQRHVGRIINAGIVSAVSIPQFWLGLILLYVFSLQLGWFPTGGMGPIIGDADFATQLQYLVLPAITAAMLPMAIIARFTRTLILELMRQDFVVTLHTRGYSTPRIWRHLLRNASPGIVNITGLQVGHVILGTIFAEVVFNWPGIGNLLVTATESRDYPVIQATLLVTGVVFAAITLTVDVIMRLLDPRLEASH